MVESSVPLSVIVLSSVPLSVMVESSVPVSVIKVSSVVVPPVVVSLLPLVVVSLFALVELESVPLDVVSPTAATELNPYILLLFAFSIKDRKIQKFEGCVFLIIFAVYYGYIIYRG